MAQVDYRQNLLGVDDIRVVSTAKGWMLRIKRGVQWFNAILYGEDIKHKDVFIPRAWHKRDVTSDVALGDFSIYLPEFINDGNILCINFMINLGSNKYHFWSWDTIFGVLNTSEGGDVTTNKAEVYYDRVDRKIVLANRGSATNGKEYRLTVFFK